MQGVAAAVPWDERPDPPEGMSAAAAAIWRAVVSAAPALVLPRDA